MICISCHHFYSRLLCGHVVARAGLSRRPRRVSAKSAADAYLRYSSVAQLSTEIARASPISARNASGSCLAGIICRQSEATLGTDNKSSGDIVPDMAAGLSGRLAVNSACHFFGIDDAIAATAGSQHPGVRR